jgi:hypothetical protein
MIGKRNKKRLHQNKNISLMTADKNNQKVQISKQRGLSPTTFSTALTYQFPLKCKSLCKFLKPTFWEGV